jgi:hypothetical protein
VTHPLHSLLHLISVSFAVCMAYVSLERFRYVNKIEKMFNDAKIEVDKMEVPIDAISIRLRNRFDEFRKCRCCKIFGITGSTGWDVIVVDVFLFIQFIWLVVATYHYYLNPDNLFLIMFISSCSGIIIPFILIVIGARYVQFYKNKVDTILNDTKQYDEEYKIKINKMVQQV